MSVKTVASLLHDMDLSTKKIQVFTNKTRSIYYNITIDEVILEKILLLISGFKRVQQKDTYTPNLHCNVFTKNEHILFYGTFLSLWMRNWRMINDVMKKITIQHVLKKPVSQDNYYLLVFILSHAERFLFDLINQYYTLFTTKLMYMLSHSKTKQTDLTK